MALNRTNLCALLFTALAFVLHFQSGNVNAAAIYEGEKSESAAVIAVAAPEASGFHNAHGDVDAKCNPDCQPFCVCYGNGPWPWHMAQKAAAVEQSDAQQKYNTP